ncbi:MAG: serine/threonine-protein kinase, partial [Ktedonobacterales bacterium]
MGPEGAMFGPYRVLRRLGGGAAGEVYLAETTNTSASPAPGTDGPQQIALKVLSGTAQDATTQDIASKAHAAGQLRHPHIIPFYGVVQHEGRLGIAMAYAPGGSLGDTLAHVAPDGTRKLPLPFSSGIVARLVAQLARALTAAHDVGLVHGDLKPNNIFVRTAPGGQPLAALSDFGQAVLTGSAAALLARGGASQQPGGADHWPASQLLFAAPEQLRGETTSASDQYALAAIAYYLLTGGAPISSEGPGLLQAIQRQAVVAPTLRNAEVPAEIDAVLLRGLAKEPGSRFPTTALFAQAVDEALAAGVSVGSTSMTMQFSRLAGSTPGMPSPTAAQAVAARAGGQTRQQGAPAAAGRPVTPSQALNVPADTPPMINRRLAIITAAALLVSILACAFTFRAFQGAAILPHFNLSGPITGINPAPTPTPNAAATATARAETSQWKAATANPPIFKDALAKNDNHWATDGKTVFFASDGLHIHKTGASPAIGVNAPGPLPKLQDQNHIAATVDISFNSGNPGDLAGMRFFVTPNGAGSEDYYAFLISSEGRYEFWLHQDRTWTFLRSGYSNAFKLGHGQTNTLAVLGDSTNRSAALYANGQFLVTVDLSNKGPAS